MEYISPENASDNVKSVNEDLSNLIYHQTSSGQMLMEDSLVVDGCVDGTGLTFWSFNRRVRG